MATVSGTLTAPGQVGNFLFLRAGELATISVSRTGSNAWSAELVATENQPPGRLPAVARFTSDTTGFTYRNETNRSLYLTIVAGLLAPTESIAFTVADVTGDVILQDWVAPDGSLAFRITDEGPIGGVNGYFGVTNIGGSVGENLIWNPVNNAIASDVAASVIPGGGNAFNPQLIGYRELRDRFNGDGVNTTWTTTFDASSPSSVRVRLIRTDKVRVTVTSFCTITIVGGKAQVIYPRPGQFVNNATGGAEGSDPALLTTEQLEIVGIRAVENLGSLSNYSGIYGGYNNIIQQGVMQHILGAHHRIVAGDHNTILGGSYARVDAGSYGVVLGGTANEAAATGTGNLVLGGNGNTTSGSGPGFILGGSGNLTSAAFATIAGGANNTVSGNGAFATGREHSVTGRDSFVGGYDHTVSGVYGFACGLTNVASGAYASAMGRDNTASAESGVVSGREGNARLIGAHTLGGQKFATVGDCQSSAVTIRRQTTTATPAVLLAQSSALTIPTNTTWAFECLVSARRVDGGGAESAAYHVRGAIKNDAGTTALLGSPVVTVIGENDAAWDIAATANNTNDSLEITVTGASAKTINWVGRLSLAEVSG